jgi:hypothetical protein
MTLRELKDKLERILDEMMFKDDCSVYVETAGKVAAKLKVEGIRFETGKNGESVTLILE